MKFVLMYPESCIEEELQDGATQRSVALTYCMAMRSADHGETVDWPRINNAIRKRWPKGLVRVKMQAHRFYEGKEQP